MIDWGVMPGPSTYSKGHERYPANAPRLAVTAEGCFVYARRDKTLERYVDYVSALGAVVLGYDHPAVSMAVLDAINRGITSASLPTYLEYKLAQRLAKIIPGAEMVRFAKNGADVTGAAVRIARAHTDRPGIAIVEGGYHGHHPWSMGRPPKNGGVLVGEAYHTREVRQRFSLTAWESILIERTTAAVIIEPVLSSDPVVPPPGYFRELRELCDATGTLLIFDEMVTGFRSGFPGYPTDGVVADLYCYGKALANGMPLSVLAGRRDLIDRISEDVFFSTTFGGECLSLAAADATLDVLERENVARVLAERGRLLEVGYEVGARAHGLTGDTWIYGYPARLMTGWKYPEDQRVFAESMVELGFLVHRQPYFNLMLAHDDAIIDQTIAAFSVAFQAVRAARPRAA